LVERSTACWASIYSCFGEVAGSERWLHRFLALNGIESEINFGVRKEIDGTVTAHAWLEHQGKPVLEDDADAYIVTFSLPRKPSASGYVTVERAQSSVETAVRKFVAHHLLSQTSR
jgi:hypothetical protein